MARLSVPERFMRRPVDDLSTGLEVVTAWYWHLHAQGEIQDRYSQQGAAAVASLEAMHWLAGLTPIPPGHVKPLARTRTKLFQVFTNMELALSNSTEDLADHVEVDQSIELDTAMGARQVFAWALGLSNELPGSMLRPEEIRAARSHWQSVNRTAAA